MEDDQGVVEAAQAEISRRVAEGMASGKYSAELDAQLASHFSRMSTDRLWFSSFTKLQESIAETRGFRFGREFIELDSSMPGGSQVHRIVGKAVSRSVLGVLQQMINYSRSVQQSLEALHASLSEVRGVIEADLLGDIDEVHARITDLEFKVAQLAAEQMRSTE